MASPVKRYIGFVSFSFSFRVVRASDAKLCEGVSETIFLSLALKSCQNVRVSIWCWAVLTTGMLVLSTFYDFLALLTFCTRFLLFFWVAGAGRMCFTWVF